MTATKSLLIAAVPRPLKMPLRYWYRMAARRLDPEMTIVSKLIHRDEVFLDVGANHGLYSYALARCGAIVHAFEPQPTCAGIIRAFHSTRISVHEIALSDRRGRQVLYIPLKGGRPDTGEAALERPDGEFERLEVELETLDTLALGPVSLLKIDVEGHELQVLKGARDTLDRYRPFIVCEIEQRHLSFSLDTVFRELLDRGYSGFFVWSGAIRPLDSFDLAQHQDPNMRLIAPKRYVNNFLFVHRDDARRRRMEALRMDSVR